MANETGIAGSDPAVSTAAIGLGVVGMRRIDGMAGPVDALVPEEMRNPKILDAANFVEPDDVDVSQFAGPLIDLLGSQVLIGGEDFELNALGLVGLASHVVDETPEADEKIAALARHFCKLLIGKSFGFQGSESRHERHSFHFRARKEVRIDRGVFSFTKREGREAKLEDLPPN